MSEAWLYLDAPTDELWFGGEPDGTRFRTLGGFSLDDDAQALILAVWSRTCPAAYRGAYCYAHHPDAEAEDVGDVDYAERVSMIVQLAQLLDRARGGEGDA